MKKNLAFVLVVLLVTSNLQSQMVQQKSWADGDPTFSRISTSQGVIVGSTIQLIPKSETLTIDTLQFILYGEDAVWDNNKIGIAGARDIDFFTEEDKPFYLVTDVSNQKVFDVNYTNPNIPVKLSEFVEDKAYNIKLVKPVDAHLFYEDSRKKVLITDASEHRVIKVHWGFKEIQWVYGNGNAGKGFNQLSSPMDAVALFQNNELKVIIADRGNGRVILVNQTNNAIEWSYGEAAGELIDPVDVEYDATRDAVLITDQSNRRVVIVKMDTTKSILWDFNDGNNLNNPEDADLLANGDVLICDTGNNRLLEVNNVGEIVWSFEHRPLMNLWDADRLPDGRTLIIADDIINQNPAIPTWLAYSDSIFETGPFTIREAGLQEKYVNFDSLFWSGVMPSGTRIKLQLRSADNSLDLVDAPWRGPTDSENFFTNPASAVNPLYHSAHAHFQFRIFLETDNLQFTPILNSFGLRYHFYDKEQSGSVTSQIIADASDRIVIRWLNFNYDAVETGTEYIKISIIDASTGKVLIDDAEANQPLSFYDNLRGVQSIQLNGILTTKTTARTPILDNWVITWESTNITNSQLDFIDAKENPVSFYRLASVTHPPNEKLVDQVSVRLTDPNLAMLQDSISLKIKALQSEDEVNVKLIKNLLGEFLLKYSIPAVISNSIDKSNDTLEVFDRDTLFVSYTDPKYSQDQSSDRAFILQNTIGDLQFVDSLGVPIDSVVFKNSKLSSVKYDTVIYISVKGEKDRDVSSLSDSFFVKVLDNKTGDEESVLVKELPDSLNNYRTGNFMSVSALPLANAATGIPNDKKLQTQVKNQIAANYEDNVLLQDFIYVKLLPGIGPDTLSPQIVLDVIVAPNPFDASKHTTLKMRAGSTVGNLQIDQIEIYSLAGHRVRNILFQQLPISIQRVIPQRTFASTENWWDLRDDNDNPVSSGTYWVKLHGRFLDNSGQVTSKLNKICKLVIVR